METKQINKRLNKGRCIAVLVLLLLMIILLVNSFSGAKAAENSQAMQAVVVVVEGDTLWGLVQKHYAYKGDIRKAIYEVRKINALKDAVIIPGQVIYMPQ